MLALLELRAGEVRRARRLLDHVPAARRRGAVADRVQAWYAEAELRAMAGDRAGARRAVRAGMRIVEEHADALGAAELQASAAAHGSDLAALGTALGTGLRPPGRRPHVGRPLAGLDAGPPPDPARRRRRPRSCDRGHPGPERGAARGGPRVAGVREPPPATPGGRAGAARSQPDRDRARPRRSRRVARRRPGRPPRRSRPRRAARERRCAPCRRRGCRPAVVAPHAGSRGHRRRPDVAAGRPDAPGPSQRGALAGGGRRRGRHPRRSAAPAARPPAGRPAGDRAVPFAPRRAVAGAAEPGRTAR